MFQKTYDDDDSEGWTPSESDSESDDDAPTDYTNMAAYFLKDKQVSLLSTHRFSVYLKGDLPLRIYIVRNE